MKEINVSAGTNYVVKIGQDILKECGKEIGKVTKAKQIALVTDDIVNTLYADCVQEALEDANYSVYKFVFPNGEASKNIYTYAKLLEFLAEHTLTRTDAIVALGGGVVGDLAGFAAATYLRGIDYIQIPTTLLAAVDSSVGGKTAIDLEKGKNLCGAFYQPKLVLCDYITLASLPPCTFADGMAEVIKYGMIFSKEFLDFLQEKDAKDHIEEVIAQCVELKRDIVNQDEKEQGVRALLNFGHTIGHAIEQCSAYQITHGSAVAIGMAIVSKAAYQLGLSQEDCTETVLKLNQKYKLPSTCKYTANELTAVALSDKKRNGNDMKLIVPKKRGTCEIYKINIECLQDFIEKGLT